MAISKPFYVSGAILLYVYCMLYDNVTYRKDKRTCFAVGQTQEITFEKKTIDALVLLASYPLSSLSNLIHQTDQTLRPKYR